MKKLILFHLLIFIHAGSFSQKSDFRRCRGITFNKGSGYASINELQYGYGIASSDSPYGKQYLGFTSTHGYQLNISSLHINNSLLAGIGTGVLLYDAGPLIPLYLDFRFMANYWKISPFIYEVNGILLNTEDVIKGTKMFINPGVGIKLKISRLFTATFGSGLFVQMGDNAYKDSFFAFRAGIIFKPVR